MGVRGEIFSSRIILPNRTYFFNVKENRMGDLYLNIVESKNRETGGFDRQSVILFADDLQQFLKGFDESLKVMEKAVREKRHGMPTGGEGKPHRGDKSAREEKPYRRDNHRDRPAREGKDRGNFAGGKKGRFEGKRAGGKNDYGRREGGKRFVVKKHDKN